MNDELKSGALAVGAALMAALGVIPISPNLSHLSQESYNLLAFLFLE
jgi:hypothetical protein